MKELVSSIMERDVITVDISDPLTEVMKIFDQVKIRHIPVVAGETLVGIISHSDVSRLCMGSEWTLEEKVNNASVLDKMVVNQLMKSSPVTIGKDHSIMEAAKIFTENPFHALPVTDDNNLVGIITTTDLIKYMIEKDE